jgi:hypothetical protein
LWPTTVEPPELPWKRIVITKLTAMEPGFDQGWKFDLSYPGGAGLSNTTWCYITNPQAAVAKTLLRNSQQEEIWTSSVSGNDADAVRNATYQLKVRQVQASTSTGLLLA